MAKETLRGVNWTCEETVALIECWSAEEIENDFSVVHRNKHIYEKIAVGLKERGIDRTWESCRTKVKGLRQSYLKAKLQNHTSGQSRSRFLHFDMLEEFLGSKPLTEPSCVVDTANNVGAKDKDHETTETPETEELVGEKENNNGMSSTKGEQKTEKRSKDSTKAKARKRPVDESFNEFVHALVEMEERQTKVQFEQEEKRRRLEDEVEERRTASERQFQLQLFQMQAQMQMQMTSLLMGHQTPMANQTPGSGGDNEAPVFPIHEAFNQPYYFDL